jgi:4-amino-4-deoxy-L-arabinose transferase-like glycosyltransferase
LKKYSGFIFVFVAILIVYALGLPTDVMEVDAAQYANISSGMFESREYFQLFCRGDDYLDKPPFLFWICQPFYFVFGVHDWSYKLGSLLFICLGLYSTYRLGKLLYNTETGLVAASILGTTQAWFLITQDVKTDGILASTIIFSVWQWKCFIEQRKWKDLLGFSIGIALSMLTKGPIGFVVPVMVIGSDLLVNRQLKLIFSWKYLVALLIISILLAPMLYGLYVQFDLHPGKTVSGGQVVNSGLRYYFWTQSFGRITGESVWKGNSSPLYFLPELAWSFLPWILFTIQATFMGFKKGFKQNIIPLAGFILPFIALSFSNYKLSHYIFICYPFLAILVAHYLVNLKWKFLSKLLVYLFQVIGLVGIFLVGYCFNIPVIYSLIISVAVLAVAIPLYIKKVPLFFGVLITAIGLNLFLTGFAYPALLEYQSSSKAGQEYLVQQSDKKIPLVEIGVSSFSMEFYAQTKVQYYHTFYDLLITMKTGEYWIYLDEPGYKELQSLPLDVRFHKEFKYYPVSRLSGKFIWPETRDKLVSKTHLVKVYLP